jgi:hypothetical protein
MPRQAKPLTEQPDTIRITINPTVRAYLGRFVATGLYGNSDPEAALKLIQLGIERSIESRLISRIERTPLKEE